MSELARLFESIGPCRDSIVRVTDAAVAEIMRLKDEALLAEQEHEKRKAEYHAELERLSKELVELRRNEMHERRNLQHLKEQQENTKRLIEREKAAFRRTIDEAAQLAASQRVS